MVLLQLVFLTKIRIYMTEKLKQEIQVVVNRYKYGDFQGVLKKCSQLVKKFPKNDFIWNLTGLAFQQVRNNQSAITSFQNAIYANPKNISAKNNLAISYKNEKQFGKSKKILNEILKENPKYINALVNLANLQNETYFFDEALKNYNKALTINSDLPEIYLNISNILQVKNEMDEAKDYLYKSLKLNKNFTTADRNLSMLLDYSNNKNDDHCFKMLDKIKDPSLSDNNKTELHFALGKSYEDKKDYENSFKHYEFGNNIKMKINRSSLNKFKKQSEDLKNYFANFNFSNLKRKDEGKNIFILGLPRSGTTLLEKIISSHSKVGSVSEIGYVHDQINRNIIIDNKIDTKLIDRFINLDFNKEYSNQLSFYNIQKEFIIDKTLTNFWHIGFIKIFFPNSKIIHSFRDPKDNCLSIYKNLFINNETWLYSQEDIGEYYLIYNDLMKFWNKIFKGQIFNSKYEDLINNHEQNTKELIKFCNLEWEDQCLDHHKNKNPIKTLSINQANKPIYKTSINSSKFYEKKLYKLFSILDRLS